MLTHFSDYIKFWGSIGMYNEQSIESFHQLIIRYDNALVELKEDDRMATLIQRLANKSLFPKSD